MMRGAIQFAPIDRTISLAQLVSLLGGLWWLGSEVARRDLTLSNTVVRVDELAGIVSDLAKASVANATADQGRAAELADLRNRLERLETQTRRGSQ